MLCNAMFVSKEFRSAANENWTGEISEKAGSTARPMGASSWVVLCRASSRDISEEDIRDTLDIYHSYRIPSYPFLPYFMEVENNVR